MGETTTTLTPGDILRPSKSKWGWMLIGCCVFVLGGVLMLQDEDVNRFDAYGATIFFGLCGVVALVQLLPNTSCLRVDTEGFTVQVMGRQRQTRWSDIETFGVAEVPFTGPLRRSRSRSLQRQTGRGLQRWRGRRDGEPRCR